MTWGFGDATGDAIIALKFATGDAVIGDAVIGDAVIGDADSAVKFDMAAISSRRELTHAARSARMRSDEARGVDAAARRRRAGYRQGAADAASTRR